MSPSPSKSSICQVLSWSTLLSTICHPFLTPTSWALFSPVWLYSLACSLFAHNFLHHLWISDIQLSSGYSILQFLLLKIHNYLKWGKKTQTTVVGCVTLTITPILFCTSFLWHKGSDIHFSGLSNLIFLTIQVMLGMSLSYRVDFHSNQTVVGYSHNLCATASPVHLAGQSLL